MGVALRMGAVVVIFVSAWFVSLLPLPGFTDRGAVVDGPVIAADEDWDAYPTAAIRGYLSLRGGCLLLKGDVVFWPHGTTWHDEESVVMFGGHFEAARDARPDTYFRGSGGVFEPDADLRDVLGRAGADAVRRCLRTTGAPHVVFAYPSLPGTAGRLRG